MLVSAYQLPGNPVLLTAESEMYPRHGVGASMCGADDYTWDFYKLLLVQSPFRILIARVGASGSVSEADRMAALRESLATVMIRHGHALIQDAELAAILLPESCDAGFRGIQIGTWGAEGWSWTSPSRRPTDIAEIRGA